MEDKVAHIRRITEFFLIFAFALLLIAIFASAWVRLGLSNVAVFAAHHVLSALLYASLAMGLRRPSDIFGLSLTARSVVALALFISCGGFVARFVKGGAFTEWTIISIVGGVMLGIGARFGLQFMHRSAK